MKIVLLNLLDSMMSGAAAFIFFSDNSWKEEIPTAILYNTSHICMQLYYLCSHYIYFNWQYIDTGSLFTFNLIIFTLFLPKFSLFSQFAN